MAFNPAGVGDSSGNFETKKDIFSANNTKEEFKILKVLEKRYDDNYYKAEIVPQVGRSFSIQTEEGVYSARTAKVSGFSALFSESNFKEGDNVICYGRWRDTPDDGLIFSAINIYEEIPTNVETLRKFLSGKRLPRIGEAVANKIIDKWGIKTFDILDNEPEKLSEISGINKDHISIIKDKWQELRKVYELIAKLSEFGVSEDIAKKAYRYFKEKEETMGEKVDIIKFIKENPYDLINIKGIGFKKADSVGMALGHNPKSKKRIGACLKFCLEELINNTGNTAIPASLWILKFQKETDYDLETSQKCCQWFINTGGVIFKKVNVLDKYGKRTPTDCVILKSVNEIERSIAKNLKRIKDNAPKLSDLLVSEIKDRLMQKDIIADDTQKEAIMTAVTNGVSIVTGGPGTGKTTTCKNIVNIFSNILRKSIYLAAPTGKAAQRMGQQIGQGIESETIHRLLGSKTYFFEYNENNQLNVAVYIIDESSMIDIFIADALLKAIPSGSVLIFVGDADQLPSVGAGDFLRDIILSGYFNVARLKVPHRYDNGADIGQNAELINKGEMPDLTKGKIEKNDSFVFIQKSSDGEILRELTRVAKYLNEEGGVPFKDIQVLSPQKNKLVGVDTLNMELRPLFNKEMEKVANMQKKPRIYDNDRIMQTENNYELDLFNGDVGYVSDYNGEEETFIFNEVVSGKEVRIEKMNISELTLAYAITVHKSQGSESPYIIIPISANHHYTLNRNNIYTGVTRAKKMVILIGDVRTFRESIKKVQQRLRITMLNDELEQIFQ